MAEQIKMNDDQSLVTQRDAVRLHVALCNGMKALKESRGEEAFLAELGPLAGPILAQVDASAALVESITTDDTITAESLGAPFAPAS